MVGGRFYVDGPFLRGMAVVVVVWFRQSFGM